MYLVFSNLKNWYDQSRCLIVLLSLFASDSCILLSSKYDVMQIWVPSNPRGAERLAPGIVAAESDFYLHRLWGNPNEVCFDFAKHNFENVFCKIHDFTRSNMF